MLRDKARWYVYTLSDPRDGAVFYVGKGCGARIEAHEREVVSGRSVCSKKARKIKDIWAADGEVSRAQIAFFWDEQAAYDHETDLIAEIGLENLTNVLPGGQVAWTLREEERRARRATEYKQPFHVWLRDLLSGGGGAFAARCAEWLKAGGRGGTRWEFEALDPRFAIHAQLSEYIYNKMIPDLWERICADGAAVDVARTKLRPYGVEVV